MKCGINKDTITLIINFFIFGRLKMQTKPQTGFLFDIGSLIY